MADTRDSALSDANEALQHNLDRNKPVIFTSYAIIGAVLFLGGVGYALDRQFGTLPWISLGGVVLGLGVAFYALVKRTHANVRV